MHAANWPIIFYAFASNQSTPTVKRASGLNLLQNLFERFSLSCEVYSTEFHLWRLRICFRKLENFRKCNDQSICCNIDLGFWQSAKKYKLCDVVEVDLHCEVVDEAFPACRPFQKVVDWALKGVLHASLLLIFVVASGIVRQGVPLLLLLRRRLTTTTTNTPFCWLPFKSDR